jgi:CHAT domain-containing protein/tetratricopeptide (TPR) repeat protein
MIVGWLSCAPGASEAASDLLFAGDYQTAEDEARRRLVRLAPDTGAEAALARAELAEALAANGRLADGEADELAAAAVALARHLPNSVRGRSWLALGAVQLAAGRFDDAAASLTSAERSFADCGEDCRLQRAQGLAGLARAEVGRQRFDAALAAVARGLESVLPGTPDGPLLEARLFDVRALALLYQGRVSEGHAAAEEARSRRTRLGRPHPDGVVSEIALGDADNMAGRLDEALDHGRAGWDLASRTLRDGHPPAAWAASRLASREADRGDFGPAFERHVWALAAVRANLGAEHPQVVDQLIDFGNAYYQAGDPRQAGTLYAEALAIVEELQGAEALPAATLAYNLAFVQAAVGDWPSAEASLGRALRIWRGAHGDEHVHIALALAEWAQLLGRLGRDAEAVTAYESALDLRLRLSGPEHPSLAGIRAGLAECLARLGRADEAEALAAQAAAALAGRPGWRERLRADVLALQGRLALARGDARSSEALARTSAELFRAHVVKTVRFLGEFQALSYVERGYAGRDVLLALASRPGAAEGTRRAAFEALAGSRHLVLDEMALRAAMGSREIVPEHRRRWRELLAARERLATLVYRDEGSLGEGEAALREAQERVDELERRAALSGAVVASPLAPTPGWEQLHGALPKGTSLVSFACFEAPATGHVAEAGRARPARRCLAFVVRRADRAPRVVPLGDERELDRRDAAWQAAVDRRLFGGAGFPRETVEAGRALADWAWRPIAPLTTSARRLLLVPEGSLALLNPAAWPAGRGRYLIEEGPTLHQLSSERDLLAPPLPRPASPRLLVVADPAFDRREALGSAGTAEPRAELAYATLARADQPSAWRWGCGRPPSLRWDSLPASGLEAQDVAHIWSRTLAAPVQVLAGGQATEQAFKLAAPAADVVHVASHGFRLDQACAGGPATDNAADRTGWRSPPLVAAGLPLAGANQRWAIGPGDSDGILTGMEVAGLDLHAARWVVLSACDTGLGRVHDGEGVLGLRRAFAIAGARTVLMSLWPVEDRLARRFMAGLYRARLVRGLDTAGSVRAATLDLLRDLRREGAGEADPVNWGAFVAAGDWR